MTEWVPTFLSPRKPAELRTSEELLGDVQGVPEAEVLAPEQGQEQLVLLLSAVLWNAGQKLLEVRPLGVTQHFLPCGEADHLKEYLGLGE